MNKNKRMPIGVDDFRELRKGYYFVDKTNFIRDIIENRGKVTLITRPRRFGKTLTMSMLYYFFANENAEENRALFEGCAIAEAGEEYMAEQGTRPVVFFSLKDVKAADFETMMELMKDALCEIYRSFIALLDSRSLIDEEKESFRNMLKKKASAGDMQVAVKKLCQELQRHYRRPAILLIDEYDAPIQSAWEHGYYDKAIVFFRNFLGSALKSNPALDFAVLTGVLRISKESIFSALNNLKVSSVIRGPYADSMGFTASEVKKMASELGHDDKIEEIQKWYDGYNFSGYEIYNPWSVVCYFDEGCKAAPYWVNTSGNGIMKTMLTRVDEKSRSDIMGLMRGKTVCAVPDEGLIYEDIYRNKDALYTILLTTGYLKCVGTKTEFGREMSELAIPNREIKFLFDREILRNLSGDTGESTVLQMLKSMINGEKENFADTLRFILRENVCVHDAAYPETFYHGMMLGFALLMGERYEIASNRESGYGRFDLAFIPKDKEKAGVILEFKKAKAGSDLEEKAEEALKEIEERAYDTELTKRGIKTIWKYGVAFCGKELEMARG